MLPRSTALQILMLPSSVNLLTKSFQAFTRLENTQHGFPVKTTNVDPDYIINEIEYTNLEKELQSCQPFLADSELEM